MPWRRKAFAERGDSTTQPAVSFWGWQAVMSWKTRSPVTSQPRHMHQLLLAQKICKSICTTCQNSMINHIQKCPTRQAASGMKSYKGTQTPYSCSWKRPALNPSPPSIQALTCSKKTWEVNQEPNCHPQSFCNGRLFFLLVALQPLCMNLAAAPSFANLETCKIDKGYSQTKLPCVRDSQFHSYNPSLMVTFVVICKQLFGKSW